MCIRDSRKFGPPVHRVRRNVRCMNDLRARASVHEKPATKFKAVFPIDALLVAVEREGPGARVRDEGVLGSLARESVAECRSVMPRHAHHGALLELSSPVV